MPTPLIYSPMSAQSSTQVAVIPCGIWWLIVVEALELSIPLDVLGPVTSVMPGGIKAPASHTFEKSRPQTVHEILGDKFPIITKASEVKSTSQPVYALFQGKDAYDAFAAIWDGGYTCLLQSDTTDQWYVDLGATEKLDEVQSVDPNFTTMYVVSIATREVDAPA